MCGEGAYEEEKCVLAGEAGNFGGSVHVVYGGLGGAAHRLGGGGGAVRLCVLVPGGAATGGERQLPRHRAAGQPGPALPHRHPCVAGPMSLS